MVAMARRRRVTWPPLTPAQQDLVVSALPAARLLAARRTWNRPGLFQQYLDGAVLGLIHAALAFDPAREKPFIKLAWTSMCHALTAVERYRRREKRAIDFHSVSLDATKDAGRYTGYEAGAIRRDGATPTMPARLADGEPDFAGLIVSLSGLERRALSLRFERGKTNIEVARALGINREAARTMILGALDKLSVNLTDPPNREDE